MNPRARSASSVITSISNLFHPAPSNESPSLSLVHLPVTIIEQDFAQADEIREALIAKSLTVRIVDKWSAPLFVDPMWSPGIAIMDVDGLAMSGLEFEELIAAVSTGAIRKAVLIGNESPFEGDDPRHSRKGVRWYFKPVDIQLILDFIFEGR